MNQHEPSAAEQEAAFMAECEQRNAGLNGRHDPGAPPKPQADPVAARLAEARLSPVGAAGRLYRAACAFPGPFGLTALVLAAWVRFPRTFGLAGAENLHASDNKVRTLLYGARGLIARGLVVKCEGGLMRVAGKLPERRE